jgi:hypothetical protein
MTKEQEEFEKLRKRLYALAEKMGMQLTMALRRKSPAEVKHLGGIPGQEMPRSMISGGRTREPGEE